MTPRELGGAITRAEMVLLWVTYGPRGQGIYIDISKVQARAIVDDARVRNIDDIDAQVNHTGSTVHIGSEIEIDDDGASEEPEVGPVCSGCGEPWDDDDHECEDE